MTNGLDRRPVFTSALGVFAVAFIAAGAAVFYLYDGGFDLLWVAVVTAVAAFFAVLLGREVWGVLQDRAAVDNYEYERNLALMHRVDFDREHGDSVDDLDDADVEAVAVVDTDTDAAIEAEAEAEAEAESESEVDTDVEAESEVDTDVDVDNDTDTDDDAGDSSVADGDTQSLEESDTSEVDFFELDLDSDSDDNESSAAAVEVSRPRFNTAVFGAATKKDK